MLLIYIRGGHHYDTGVETHIHTHKPKHINEVVKIYRQRKVKSRKSTVVQWRDDERGCRFNSAESPLFMAGLRRRRLMNPWIQLQHFRRRLLDYWHCLQGFTGNTETQYTVHDNGFSL